MRRAAQINRSYLCPRAARPLRLGRPRHPRPPADRRAPRPLPHRHRPHGEQARRPSPRPRRTPRPGAHRTRRGTPSLPAHTDHRPAALPAAPPRHPRVHHPHRSTHRLMELGRAGCPFLLDTTTNSPCAGREWRARQPSSPEPKTGRPTQPGCPPVVADRPEHPPALLGRAKAVAGSARTGTRRVATGERGGGPYRGYGVGVTQRRYGPERSIRPRWSRSSGGRRIASAGPHGSRRVRAFTHEAAPVRSARTLGALPAREWELRAPGGGRAGHGYRGHRQ